jgi:CheY-like chemotaxis protein
MSLSSVPRNLRFLVVEDDDLNFLIMRTSIEAGFRELSAGAVTTAVTHAKTGEEAMRLVGDGPACAYDVVVCDQHMETAGGVMKGTEFMSLLRRKEFQPRSPVAALASGNNEEADVTTYHACGADIVWPKPYPPALQMARDVATQLHKRSLPTLLQAAAPVVEVEQPKPVRSLRTFIPDVPTKEYDTSRRKTVAKREVGLVRAITTIDAVVRTITVMASIFGPAHLAGWGASLAQLLFPWCLLAWAWDPKRWLPTAYAGNAFLLLYFGYVVFESGACDDPAERAIRCVASRQHLSDPASITLYYVGNTICFLWGGLKFETHMRTVAAEAVLIVASAVLNGALASSVAVTTWTVSAFFCIVLCVERKRRLYYLQSVLAEQACRQQQQLVTLLW